MFYSQINTVNNLSLQDEEGIKAMHLEEVEGTVLVIRAG